MCYAQAPKIGEQYKPTRMEEYVAYCALWRTDASFRSTIRISNQLATSEIDVIPMIYMADGTAWELAPVHLGKSGVETLDINAILAKAPQPVQGHLSSYGSASIRYRYDWQGAVYATMSILDFVRSLDYSVSFVFPPGQGIGENLAPKLREVREAVSGKRYEGLWFRRDRTAGGFLALSNTSAASIGVHLLASGLPNPVERDYLLAGHCTTLVDLTEIFGGDEARTGGITVSQTGAPGALQLAGGLADFTTGYSADMPIVVTKTKQGEKAERQYASVGLMVNEQDYTLGFPSGLKFVPYAFLRNLANESRTLHFSANYMIGRTVYKLALPDATLSPGEAREVVIRDIFLKRPEVADFNLVYSYTGDFGDVLAAIGSTDATANYVFPVPPEPVVRSGTKRSTYWLADGGFDTMYTVWNPLSTPQELQGTIYYGTKGETYILPLHMEPFASAMIDIGELMRTQQSDPDGKVLPLGAKHGALDIGPVTGQPEDLITVALSGGIYNPQKATCGQTCNYCTGVTYVYVSPSSFGLSVNGSLQGSFGYTDQYGYRHDVSSASDWSSLATSIATVQTQTQTSPGLATGVSAGNTTITANYVQTLPVNGVYQCSYYGYPPCPMQSYISASSPAPVKPTITGPNKVWYFGGLGFDSTNYPTQITLASSSPASWSASSPGSTSGISFTVSGNNATVTTDGSYISANQGDVKVTATVNGLSSDQFSITIATAHYRSGPSSTNYSCIDPGQSGWHHDIFYKVVDNFNTLLPGVPVNEVFSGSTTWPQPASEGAPSDLNGQFTDGIFICGTPGTYSPNPVQYTDGSGTTLVDSFNQTWCVGSSVCNSWGAACNGRQIQNGILRRYLDHGTVVVQ
jgi:hypothetical protein